MPIILDSDCTVKFGELQVEFYARGFDYLDQDDAGRTRAKRWINEAYLEDVCAGRLWDFLRTTESNTAPITIVDIDTVDSVWNQTQAYPLVHTSAGELEAQGVDLTTEGWPTHWYFTDEETIAVWPVSATDTIQVRYFVAPTEMLDEDEDPLLPCRWRTLVVDAAVVRAYWDSDNTDTADRLEQRFNRRLARMLEAELYRSLEPASIIALSPE